MLFYDVPAELFKGVRIVEAEVDAALPVLVHREDRNTVRPAVFFNVQQDAFPQERVRENDHSFQHVIVYQLKDGHFSHVCGGEREIEISLGMKNKKTVSFCDRIAVERADALETIFFLESGETYTNDARGIVFLHVGVPFFLHA